MKKQNIKIFIIDDNATNVKMLSIILKKEGYLNVWKYTDPKQALDEFQKKRLGRLTLISHWV